jgi:transposase
MLRLHHDGLGAREIGRRLHVARSTIQDNLKRTQAAGLAWPLAPDLTDEVLEQRLFGRGGSKPSVRRRAEPDWAALARELKRPGVNLVVLWEEYRADFPGGYGYSRFCDLFREFEQRLSPVMRQTHVAGDKVFVDYSGKRLGIVDPATGEIREAEIFVAVLGASGYTYAEATWSQTLPDWIGSHVRMFEFFQGCPRLVVPDNLKSGVNKPSFFDPEINRSYAMMAAHYGVGVLPARPRRPKDKAKVEAGVRFAQTYLLGRLRRQTFFSLDEANAAIRLALERMNNHIMRRLGVSRSDLFASVDRPALSALPATRYEYAEWSLARVSLDYHVEVDRFLYSVPHTLLREQVDVRMTSRIVEIFHRSKRVAVHQRRYAGHRAGTHLDHMPSTHRFLAEWTPQRFERWARSIGPNTEGLIIAVLAVAGIPSRPFELVSASSSFFAASRPLASRRLRPVRLPLGRLLTRASPPFCKTMSIALRRLRRARACSTTPMSAAATTSTEGHHDADPSHHRTSPWPRPARHGQGLQGARTDAGGPFPRACRMARSPARARGNAAPAKSI